MLSRTRHVLPATLPAWFKRTRKDLMMHEVALYKLAQDHVAQLRREARETRGPEPHAIDHTRSWSSLAYWQARRWQRAY